MRKILVRMTIAILVFSAACAHKRQPEVENSTQSLSSGLPIVGTWVADSYQGYFFDAMNTRRKVSLSKDQMRTDDWLIETKLDAFGNGVVKTLFECAPTANQNPKEANGIPSPRSFNMFPNALHFKQCDNGQKVNFHQSHMITAVEERVVPRNLGLDGNVNSLLNECSSLRGLRFITQKLDMQFRSGSTGCIGFADASANQLTMLLVPMGEIHAVRLDFRRVH